MTGIAKLAELPWQNYFLNKTEAVTRKNENLTSKELHALKDKLKAERGLDVNLVELDNMIYSSFGELTEESKEGVRNYNRAVQESNAARKQDFIEFEAKYGKENVIKYGLEYEPRKEKAIGGKIESPRIKEIFLHETGHALDPYVKSRSEKSHKVMRGIGGTGLATALLAGSLATNLTEDEDAQKAIVLGSGAVGGIASLPISVDQLKGEYNANRFVKEYLTEELGDAKKAKEAYKKSLLPKMLQTYHLGAIGRSIAPLAIGGSAFGLSKRIGKNKEEEGD